MFRDLTLEELWESFKVNHPPFVKRVLEFRKDGPRTLIVKLKSGTIFWYDEVGKTIRRLPDDPDEIDSEAMLVEFRKRVVKIMTARGMNQNDLADKTKIHPVQLSKYLNGKTAPSFIIAVKLAKVLGCSVDDFCYRDDRDGYNTVCLIDKMSER